MDEMYILSMTVACRKELTISYNLSFCRRQSVRTFHHVYLRSRIIAARQGKKDDGAYMVECPEGLGDFPRISSGVYICTRLCSLSSLLFY